MPRNAFAHLGKYAVAVAIPAMLLGVVAMWPGQPSGVAGATILQVDAVSDGANTASSVGTVQACREVDLNESFDVDVVISGVSSLRGWDAYVTFDNSRLQLTAFSTGFLMPEFDASFDYQDGNLYLASANTAGATGSGVLARLTFEAIATGLSPVEIKSVPPYNPHLDNDSFAGSISGTQIAVASSCSGAPTPSPIVITPSPAPPPSPTQAPTPTQTVGGTTGTPTFTPVPGVIPWGDANCMQGVTVDDAIAIAKLKANLPVTPIGSPCPNVGDDLIGGEIEVEWGDFNCDGQFNLADAVAIMRYLIGITGGTAGCPSIATNYVSIP